MPELIVAVRDLAEFCHRSGDIDYRFKSSPTGVQGVEGHQRVYRNRPASYQSEFSVEHRLPSGLVLRGRADGYDPEAGMVEEIKTCRIQPGSIPESITRLHLAQARLYAAIIAIEEDRAELEVRLTWFNIDSGKESILEQVYSREELATFLEDSMQRFSAWLEAILKLRTARDNSLASLAFPHGEFRPGQRDIAEMVYKCIDQSGQLMVEAPTGIGKTAAVLFPALKAMAQRKHDRVVFLTAKTVGREAAEETLGLFYRAGYRGNAISLTAREKICLSPGKACHGDDCPYARNYYDKLPEAMFAALEAPVLTRQALEELAGRYEVCPYQLGLDLLPWTDVVIGDVNHMYGLPAMLGGLVDTNSQRWTVLLDEAHNLPSRARGMYSISLSKAELMSVRASSPKAIGKSLNRINRVLLVLQKEPWQEQEFTSRIDIPGDLVDALRRFSSDCGEQQARDAAFLHRHPALLNFYFLVLQLLRIVEVWGEDFRFELTRGPGKQSLVVRLNCLDPARLLARRQQSLHSVTAFSATLFPPDWMQSALGLEQAVYRRQNSPFSASQMEVSILTSVDTRYRQRQQSMEALVVSVRQWLDEVPGNCIVYFPSYRYMRDALDLLQQGDSPISSRTLWQQDRNQDDETRRQLLEILDSRRDVAAFCILGGVFGEGIDLPGERLSSVVVVGVGLPQVNRDTEQLRDYFAAHYGRGFEYAYLYPGMQKVDQALGRVIRRMDDSGRALIIDQRYRQREYRELLPPWWTYRNQSCNKPGV